MRQLRRVHLAAAIGFSAGSGLAAGGAYRCAGVLILFSVLALVWSLERIRDELARREIKP